MNRRKFGKIIIKIIKYNSFTSLFLLLLILLLLINFFIVLVLFLLKMLILSNEIMRFKIKNLK